MKKERQALFLLLFCGVFKTCFIPILFVLYRVSILEEIAQGRFGVESSTNVENYDDAELGVEVDDLYEASEFQNIQIPLKAGK